VKTYYDLIGIEPAAEADEVKRAFRREIARYHPDKFHHLGVEFQEIAAARAAALTEAYRVLMDAQLRQRYDAALVDEDAARQAAPDSATAATVSPRDAVSVATPSFDSRPSRDQADAVSFVRRAVSARLSDAVTATGGTMLKVPGFDWVFVLKGARALFRKAEPSVRVAVRIVPVVDAASIEQSWPPVLRLSADGETLCLMLLGSGIASARDLSAAITDLRKKTRRTSPIVIPVDVRDWEALLPAETPAPVRALLDRLRTGE
jgi:hypothetical protein